MRKALSLAVAVLACWGGMQAASPPVTNYFNERWGFCLEYPVYWDRNEAVNRAGVELTSDHGATISIGALPMQTASRGKRGRKAVEEMAAAERGSPEDSSGKLVEQVRTLEETWVSLAGHPAIRLAQSYVQGGIAQYEEPIYFVRKRGEYELKLNCKLDERAACHREFQRVLHTFRWSCGHVTR